jgi:Na+-driven multidrug efflux pump
MLIGKLVRDEVVRTVATEYLRMLAWGVPAHIVYLIMRNVMESLHETKLSMQVSRGGAKSALNFLSSHVTNVAQTDLAAFAGLLMASITAVAS